MAELNLPAYDARLRTTADGRQQIFDTLRKKFVALTPEEWVRQHFVHYLTAHKGYPPALMANEVSIVLNGTAKRCDTVLYHRNLRARMIVEYKAPDVEITQQVFNQIVRYDMALRVDYLTVSNGMSHFCCRLDNTTRRYEFLPEVPLYDQL